MNLHKIYLKIALISPFIEILLRKIYWYNINAFSKYRPKYKNPPRVGHSINFDNIIENLKIRGVTKGSILIVHSSYDLIENSGLTPEEINQKLLDLLGANGTLVMPIIRKYKEEGKVEDYLTIDLDNVVCTYNVQKSKIVSGFLPYTLMQRPDSFVSRFPLNPVVAVGHHARIMIENNLEGDCPSPHGPFSAWQFCAVNNAIVIGLGVDMPHYLTITHVNEECDPKWPIKNWYRKRKFRIIDNDFTMVKEVYERRPIWGTIFLAENKYKHELTKAGILKSEFVEGLNISMIKSLELMEFLHNHPHKGFPYYVNKKDYR